MDFLTWEGKLKNFTYDVRDVKFKKNNFFMIGILIMKIFPNFRDLMEISNLLSSHKVFGLFPKLVLPCQNCNSLVF